MFRPALRSHFVTACGANTCGNWDAGAIPAASTFSKHASSSDSSRHIASEAANIKEFTTHEVEGNPRQQAATSAMPRPIAATKSATHLLVSDPDLAAVVASWPELSEPARSLVMEFIRAQLSNAGSNGANAADKPDGSTA
jgi:hypothetical protein